MQFYTHLRKKVFSLGVIYLQKKVWYCNKFSIFCKRKFDIVITFHILPLVNTDWISYALSTTKKLDLTNKPKK